MRLPTHHFLMLPSAAAPLPAHRCLEAPVRFFELRFKRRLGLIRPTPQPQTLSRPGDAHATVFAVLVARALDLGLPDLRVPSGRLHGGVWTVRVDRDERRPGPKGSRRGGARGRERRGPVPRPRGGSEACGGLARGRSSFRHACGGEPQPRAVLSRVRQRALPNGGLGLGRRSVRPGGRTRVRERGLSLQSGLLSFTPRPNRGRRGSTRGSDPEWTPGPGATPSDRPRPRRDPWNRALRDAHPAHATTP